MGTATTLAGGRNHFTMNHWFPLLALLLPGLALSAPKPDLHYAFEGGFDDSSGKGLNGIAIGEPTFENDTGRGGQVAVFERGAGLALPDAITVGEGDFSLSFWFRSTESEVKSPVLATNQATRHARKKGIEIGADLAEVQIRVSDGRKAATILGGASGAASVLDGEWHHIAIVFTRGVELAAYVDGVTMKRDAVAIVAPVDGGGPWTFMQDGAGGNAISGKLDELQVFNAALGEADIRALYGADLTPVPAPPFDPQAPWPTYKFSGDRKGYTPMELPMELPMPLAEEWVRRAKDAPDPAWPPPAKRDHFHRQDLKPRVVYDRSFQLVAAEGCLYFGSSVDDSVTCLDAADASPRWKFYTEGPVRFSPSYADGKLVFGSDDGAIYCIDAGSGEQIWKTVPVEGQSRLPGNGRVISLFPIRTGVLVDGGRAYYTAGLFPRQGVMHGMLDLETGKVINQTPLDTSPQGYLKKEEDGRISSPGGRASDLWLMKLEKRSVITAGRGVAIDDQYPHSAIGNDAFVVRGGEGRVAAFARDTAEKIWEAEVDGDAHCLILAYGKLYVSTDRGTIHCFGAGAAGRGREIAEADDNAPPPVLPRFEKRARELTEGLPPKGYCLLVGAGEDAPLARAIAAASELRVIIREPSAVRVATLREQIAGWGLQKRIRVHRGAPVPNPYVDYLFDLVVAPQLPQGAKLAADTRAELSRVLKPGGGALFMGQTDSPFVRPALEGAGEWTHFYGDSGNSANSGDRRIQSDALALQWWGEPGPRMMVDRHHRAAAPLFHAGKIFVSGQDWFAGVDAYNGTVRWERTIPGSMRALALKSSGNMAAADNRLYLTSRNKCLVLDGDSGATVGEVSTPDGAGDWCYISVDGGRIYGTETIRGGMDVEFTADSWTIGYNPSKEFVCSKKLFSHNIETLQREKVYTAQGVIITPTIALDGGVLYFAESISRESSDAYLANGGKVKLRQGGKGGGAPLIEDAVWLVALDAATFEEKWRERVEVGFQHAMYLIAKDGRVILYGSLSKEKKVEYELHGFDAGGAADWQLAFTPRESSLGGAHGELYQHGALVGDVFYLCNAGIDVVSGERIDTWDWQRGGGIERGHGCGTFSACDEFIFWRGTNPRVAPTGRVFKGDSPNRKISHVSRPGCWINIIPAGGLVLMPEASSGCRCGFAIQSSMAFRPTAAPAP